MSPRALIALWLLWPGSVVQAPEDPPRLVACGSVAFSGQTLCVCGHFPGPSADSLLLDGKPLGPPLTALRESLVFHVPENLTPGLHVLSGDPEAKFSPTDVVVTTLLRLEPEIDQKALLTGQKTRARFVVRGTNAPLQLHIINRSPEVVSIEGGTEQFVTTSGGPDNLVQRQVRALRKGAFSIDVELAGSKCACAATEVASRARSVPAPPGPPATTESRDGRGFLAARVAALVPAAPAAALLATAQALAVAHGLTVVEVQALPSSTDGLLVFTIPSAVDVLTVVAALNADARVRVAEPDFIFETDGGVRGQDDGSASLRYGKRLIGVSRLNASVSGKNVPVAVIDTGVDAKHPALAGRLKWSADVTATRYRSGIHGTLVAGIIADLAPGSSLLSIQACLPHSEQAITATCSTVTLTKAIDLALQKKARVINLSLGGPPSRLIERLIQQAVSDGAIVVAAAGNSGPGSTLSFPARLDAVIAVTAVDVSRSLYPYATRGSFIDLAAPGVDILSAAPGGQLIFSGTSAAAPHVSAVAALMLQEPRKLSPAMAQQLLERSALDLGPAGKDPEFGSGLLDACQSIAQLTGKPELCR